MFLDLVGNDSPFFSKANRQIVDISGLFGFSPPLVVWIGDLFCFVFREEEASKTR